MARSTNGRQTSVDDLKDDIDQLRADFAKIGGRLNDIATETASYAGERAERAVAAGADAGSDQVKRAQSTVRRYPLESCGVALGIGVLAGLLLRR